MSSPKYPRTPHLPWSPGLSNDDRVIEDMSLILTSPVIITEKLDGGNICMTQRHLYARSHSGTPKHPLFDLAKRFHAELRYRIREDESWFFEWTYGIASIEYDELPTAMHLIGIRNDDDMIWHTWRSVEITAEMHGLTTVPILHVNNFPKGFGGSTELLKNYTELFVGRGQPSVYGPEREGIVVRVAGAFHDKDFPRAVAKWVRPGHVQTDDHWMNQPIRRQKLAKETP